MTIAIITLVLAALCFVLTIYEVAVVSHIYTEVMKLGRKRYRKNRQATTQEQTEGDI